MENVLTWLFTYAWIWLPILLIVGDYITSETETEVDNDVWKWLSYVLKKVFRYGNKDKNGNIRPIYSCEEEKPKSIKRLDKLVEQIEKRVNHLRRKK